MKSLLSSAISWVLCGSLLLGAGNGAAQTFPAAGWLPLTQQGNVLGDPNDSATLTPPGIDVVGDKTLPAAYVAGDANYLYFRLRVAGTPLKTGRPGYLAFAWTCLLDTDADPQTYELLAELNGATSSADLWQNTTTVKSDDISDPAETQLATYPAGVENSPAGSGLGGGTDYFVDWAVAWADVGAAGFSKNAPFRLVCGSSTMQGALIAGDVLDNGSGSVSLSATASDSVWCNDVGCTYYDPIFKDGFEGP